MSLLATLSAGKPVPFRIAQAGFALVTVLDLWIIADTRRALTALSYLGVGWGVSRRRLVPEKTFWIWFYRVDAAVVLIGLVYFFYSGPLFR